MFENLGNKLKTARMDNKLSRNQVSELIGISVSMIGLYENGTRLPSLPVLVKLAAHYKVSVDYLLDLNTDSNNTLSLDGLTPKQVKSLKMVYECFRNENCY